MRRDLSQQQGAPGALPGQESSSGRLSWPDGVEGLCFGGDYNPEQWPAEVWSADVELMRQAGVNLVSVGVFAWSRLEPGPGRYDFAWLDRVLDLLAGAGVGVALATPTASPPPWFSLAHPDALTVTRDGTRLTHGSRDTYCLSAPAYRRACLRITEQLATRYAGHPALALWHVHNEYGTWCYCDHVAASFRRWLRARYGGLAALNEAWSSSFWSQHYSDWAQVLPPRATQYLANPCHVLDFRRFLSDELLVCFTEQREMLRALTPHTPVTTNLVFGGWVPVDPWQWACEVDVVAVDSYPSEAGPGAEEEVAFHADLARSWAQPANGPAGAPAGARPGPAGEPVPGPPRATTAVPQAPGSATVVPASGSATVVPASGSATVVPASGSATVAPASGSATVAPASGPATVAPASGPTAAPPAPARAWLLMETAATTLNEGGRLHTKEPGRLLRHALSVVARGSRGAMFFQWRASRGGAEQWHSALVGHAGARTRAFREVCELGAALTRLADVDSSRVLAEVALLWDPQAWWALQASHLPHPELDYLAAVRAAHGALWNNGTTVDFVHPLGDLTRYRMVVVPGLYLVGDDAAARLAGYVHAGGHLVVTYFSGIVDECARVRTGGYPGAFRDLLGVNVEEFHPLPADVRLPLSTGQVGRLWSESVRLTGARAVAEYTTGVLAGAPAVTRRRHGRGTAWYVSTQLDGADYARLLDAAGGGPAGRGARAKEAPGVQPGAVGASGAGSGDVQPGAGSSGAPAGARAGASAPSRPDRGDGRLELVRRVGQGTSWLFALNHGDGPAEVAAEGEELLTGAEVTGVLRLPAGAVAVIRERDYGR